MLQNTITERPHLSTEVFRDGGRKLIEQAIHAELAALMNADWLERLTANKRSWDFGFCFLYLCNVQGQPNWH